MADVSKRRYTNVDEGPRRVVRFLSGWTLPRPSGVEDLNTTLRLLTVAWMPLHYRRVSCLCKRATEVARIEQVQSVMPLFSNMVFGVAGAAQGVGVTAEPSRCNCRRCLSRPVEDLHADASSWVQRCDIGAHATINCLLSSETPLRSRRCCLATSRRPVSPALSGIFGAL